MLHDPAASEGGNSHHEEIFRDVSAGLGEQAVTTGIRRFSLLSFSFFPALENRKLSCIDIIRI